MNGLVRMVLSVSQYWRLVRNATLPMRVLRGVLSALVLWFMVEPWVQFACAEAHASANCHDEHHARDHGGESSHADRQETGDKHVCCQVSPATIARLHLPRPVEPGEEFRGFVPDADPHVEDLLPHSYSASLPKRSPPVCPAGDRQAVLSIFLI